MASTPTLWRVLPLHTPRVLRRCPRCDQTRPFQSSDRFRVNAHQRKLDVWLIYKCMHCDSTWNRTLLERCAPQSIEARLYQRYLENDRETAWRHAFDLGALGRLGLTVDPEMAFRVERPPIEQPWPLSRDLALRLEVPFPPGPRLDRLLAEELGLSRSRLGRLQEGGLLQSSTSDRDPLRKPVRDGQQIGLQADLGPAASSEAPGRLQGEERERPRAIRADLHPPRARP